MNWLFFAILSYFLISVVQILDKFILTKPIPSGALYAAYVGLAGIYGLLLIPFGFSLDISFLTIFLSLLSGFVFIIALVFYYQAALIDEISRVIPLIGAITLIFVWLLTSIFSIEKLGDLNLLAFAFLFLGSLLISFRKKNFQLSSRVYILSVFAAFLFAASWVLVKAAYLQTAFFNAFILGRIGEFMAGAFLISFPKIRKSFFEHLGAIKAQTIGLFFSNKIIASSAFIALNYATFLGNVVLIQALQGLQYLFLLIFAVLLSWKAPQILKEEIRGVIFKKAVAIIFIALGLLILFVEPAKTAGVKTWGVTYSSLYAKELRLDEKKTFLTILNELGTRDFRLVAYWPEIEKEENRYDFKDLDFQINALEAFGGKSILAIGLKLPRWPECHLPNWIKNKSLNFQKEKILDLIENTVNRYKNKNVIWAWQVENEPFLGGFGECPNLDADFLDKEIALVKSLDSRPIIISDSGELGAWYKAYQRADIFGTTMYRQIWHKYIPGGYFTYPLGPNFFLFKAGLMNQLYGKKEIINIELQAEPWTEQRASGTALEEQLRVFTLDHFKEYTEYAEKVGFEKNYLWGVEWWYWLKEKQDHPEFWEEAKKLF